jgi:predicted alpha/beta superfamily hydrolase
MSPSLWFADGKIFDFIAARPKPPSSRIYVDAGAREGRRGDMLSDAERLVLHLRARGYDDTVLGWCPDPDGRHCEPDWRKRAPSALEFLFSGARGADRWREDPSAGRVNA